MSTVEGTVLSKGSYPSSLAWTTLPVVAIGVLAMALRLYRLTGRSLWLDEIFTANVAHLDSPGQVIAFSQADIDQMPLFYFFTWLLRPWGDGEFILRLPAMVSGTLTVVAVYLLGRSLYSHRAGLVAALLTSVMPYPVWYSQEARNYTLFMLLTTIQMYFALSAIKRGRAIDWLGLAVFTILNLYTHYLALLPTSAIVIYVGLFVLVDLLRGPSRFVKGVSGAVLGVAALTAAFLHWRPILRTAYLDVSDTVTQAQLHIGAAVAAAIVSLGILAALVVFLRRRSRMIKFAATAAFGALFVLMALARGLGLLGLTGGHLPLLYVTVLVAITAALGLAAGLLLVDTLGPSRRALRQLELALMAGALVVAAYVPWLPSLHAFLSSPNKGFGRLDFNVGPSLSGLLSVLSRIGLSGLLLAAFGLGVVAIIVWTLRDRSPGSALLLAWLMVPVLLLWLSVRWAIVQVDVRYFGFLFPAAMLAVAAGVEATTVTFNLALQRSRRFASTNVRFPAAVVSLVLVVLLLAQALPALAASYQVPKEDYRAAAERIVASSPANTIVLAVGAYSDWAVICLQYYFRELNSSVTVVDGLKVTGDIAAKLDAGTGPVWGVIIFPSADQLAWLNSPGAVKTDFVDATGIVHVVRVDNPGLSPAEQARSILTWEMPLEPKLSASIKLLDLLGGQAQAGPNLVRDYEGATQGANGWFLQPGATVSDTALQLTPSPAGTQVIATFTTQLVAGGDYVVGFDCRNSGFIGSQTVDALPLDQSGRGLTTFPGASAYECRHSDSWTRSYFAIQTPPETAAIALILRATGTGTAEFRALELSMMTDSR